MQCRLDKRLPGWGHTTGNFKLTSQYEHTNVSHKVNISKGKIRQPSYHRVRREKVENIDYSSNVPRIRKAKVDQEGKRITNKRHEV